MIKPENLKDELKHRVGDSAQRLSEYDLNRQAYAGEYGEQRSQGSRAMDSTGRPLMQEQFSQNLARRSGLNMIMPIVDDYTSLRSQLPTMKVLPEGDTEENIADATTRSRILRANYLNSNMDMQQIEAAWSLTALGDSVYTLNPIFPKKKSEQHDPFEQPGIAILVHDPGDCFPNFRVGMRRFDLDDLIIREHITNEQAESQYGVVSDKEKIDVLYYYGSECNYLTVDGHVQQEFYVEHSLGFCPAVWIRNKVGMMHKMAQSDIGPIRDLHEEMRTQFMVMSDALVESTFSQLVVKDPINVGEQIEVGPGAKPIVVTAQGDVKRLDPNVPPQAAQMIYQATWESMQHMAGTSPVRTESNIGHANISARAINAIQGPMETRLAQQQAIMGTGLQMINSKILLMLYLLPEFTKQEITVWGTEANSSPYSVTFRGKDLNGWHRTSVSFSSMIGNTSHEKAAVGLQFHQEGMVPRSWVLEQVGIDDPDQLVKTADLERKQQMQDQMQMQQMAQQGQQPPQPGQGPPPQQQQGSAATAQQQQGQPSAPPGGPPSAAGGGQPEQGQGEAGGAPQQMPDFPPEQTSPIQKGRGKPGQLSDMQMRKVRQAIKSVSDQMQGQVVSSVPKQNGGIEVVITDFRDKALLRRAFQAAGVTRVTIQVASGMAALQGPGSGAAPQMPQQQQGPPPEMAGAAPQGGPPGGQEA